MADTNRLHSVNTSRILRTIWLNPGISRISLADSLNLDRSTVTKIMKVILDQNFVHTAGKKIDQTGVGRRQVHLKINTDIGVVLGLEVQDSRSSFVIVSIEGSILHAYESDQGVQKESLVHHILTLIKKAQEYLKKYNLSLLGIGIGLPGIIDPYLGSINRSNPLDISEPLPLKKILKETLNIPIFIENDANCCCWGELAFNQDNRSRNFISVLGEFRNPVQEKTKDHRLAIGTGLVIREKVLHGDHFTAGEFKSINACFTSSQLSISNNDLQKVPQNKEILELVYTEIAQNLAFLVNCLDLTKVLFTGDIPLYQDNLEHILQTAIQQNWLYQLDRNISIEFSKEGALAVSKGAAGLVIEKFFSVPDLVDRFDEPVGYDLFEAFIQNNQIASKKI